MTKIHAGQKTNWDPIPGNSNRLFSFPLRWYRLWNKASYS